MKNRFSFILLLCVGFLDYMGIGLVFTLFASLLFNPDVSILPLETSASVRGMWMGILISLTPLFQFIFSPILGSLSDQRGRKKMIILGMCMGIPAYFLGILGVKFHSLALLILYRCFLGFSTSTMAVIQAAIVDMSTPENKAKNFGLYGMALGVGFTFGPFLGGLLCDSSVVSWFDYSTPFLLGGILTVANVILLYFKFSETRKLSDPTPIEFFRGIVHAKKAFSHPVLKYVFLSFGLYIFGWDYYSEFVSVTLMQHFHFSTLRLETILLMRV